MGEINLRDAVFSVLFVHGSPVKKVILQEVFGVSPEILSLAVDEIKAMLDGLPIMLRETEESFCLVTKPEVSEYIKMFRGSGQPGQKLSESALETLAVVIMKQPCTKQEIELVRGCDCEKTLNTLTKAGLIKPVGSLKTPGSPVLYSITDDCLHRFGVKNYSELKAIVEKYM